MDAIYLVKENGNVARRVDSEDVEILFKAGRKIVKMWLDGIGTMEEIDPAEIDEIPEGFLQTSRYGTFMRIQDEEVE